MVKSVPEGDVATNPSLGLVIKSVLGCMNMMQLFNFRFGFRVTLIRKMDAAVFSFPVSSFNYDDCTKCKKFPKWSREVRIHFMAVIFAKLSCKK